MAMLNNQMIEGFLTIKWGFTLWYVTQNPTISNYEGLDDVGHIRNLPNLLSLVSSLDPSLYRFMMGLSWSMMVYDGLWWFMMVCDGLWWFMMVYDGLCKCDVIPTSPICLRLKESPCIKTARLERQRDRRFSRSDASKHKCLFYFSRLTLASCLDWISKSWQNQV